MKIIRDDNDLVVYLNKYYIKDIDLIDFDKLEEYLKNLFEIFKEKYGIIINGFYDIDIYVDKSYGAVIELVKELIDFDYYDNQIDMKISIHENNFLYEVSDLYDFINNDIYLYKKHYYLEEKNINNIIEFAQIIYKTEEITKYGKIIEI